LYRIAAEGGQRLLVKETASSDAVAPRARALAGVAWSAADAVVLEG
jgi:hypothetical protein